MSSEFTPFVAASMREMLLDMEFNKEIEIVEGEIATYRLIQFKDYKWECPDPKLGG